MSIRSDADASWLESDCDSTYERSILLPLTASATDEKETLSDEGSAWVLAEDETESEPPMQCRLELYLPFTGKNLNKLPGVVVKVWS